MFAFSSFFFGTIGIFSAVLLPLFALQVLAILFIPSMIVYGAKPRQVGRAIYYYLLQAVGILLLSLGAIPALYGVLARQNYDSKMFLALLLVFAAGGLTFLWHDNLLRHIDEHSRAVPEAVYRYTIKLIGYLVTLLAALSLLLQMLLSAPPLPAHWWAMPLIFLCYGLLLSWCTREVGKHSFQSVLMHQPPARPAHPAGKKSRGRKV